MTYPGEPSVRHLSDRELREMNQGVFSGMHADQPPTRETLEKIGALLDSEDALRQPKYVVMKIDDWQEAWRKHFLITREEFEKLFLQDCIIIRRQDFFAAPALYAYANSIHVAIKAMKADPAGYNEEVVQRLSRIADYFMYEAGLAEEEGRKVPD